MGRARFEIDPWVVKTQMQKIIEWNQQPLTLREYDFDLDPPKIVQYCFDQMNSPEGIAQLRESDKWLRNGPQKKIRLVAEYKNEIVASMGLEGCLGPKPNDHFTLNSVVTAEHSRGTGVSKLLFEFAKDWVTRYGARILLVDTWENNIPARRFYEKLGFKQYGCLPKGLINRQGEGYVDNILYYLNLE